MQKKWTTFMYVQQIFRTLGHPVGGLNITEDKALDANLADAEVAF